MWWLCFFIFVTAAAVKRPEHVRVNYTLPSGPSDQSDTLQSRMQPIRLRLYDTNHTNLLSLEVRKSLQQMFAEAAERISRILKVFPVTGPLYLSRDVTRLCAEYVPGSNEKCKIRYRQDLTETCEVDGNFQIPDEHFEDFKLYTSNNDAGVVDISGGDGLVGTDTVIYTSVGSVEFCKYSNTGILAFTKICKRDQFGRPIAAFINICSTQVAAVSRLKLSETVFHEMLHALGFAGSSLPLFVKDCSLASGALNCEFINPHVLDVQMRIPNTVLADYSDTSASRPRYELSSANAHSAWVEHVNCHHYNYDNRGPVWQVFNTAGAIKESVGDHWVIEFGMGSIMAPTVGEPYMQVLDNFTIAAFKDMGWYLVSDDYTQPLIWGKNSGCAFSHNEYCADVVAGIQQDRFFCSNRGEVGCHYLHLHKGVCNSLSSGPCLAISADEECFADKPSPEGSYEQFGIESRCFTTDSELKAMCLRRRCTLEGLLEVEVAGEWCGCPYGERLLVEAVNITVHCPPSNVLCTDRDQRLEELVAVPPDPISSTVQSSSFSDVSSPTTDRPTVRDSQTPVSSSVKLRAWNSLLVFLLMLHST